jgi:hypothetical protein
VGRRRLQTATPPAAAATASVVAADATAVLGVVPVEAAGEPLNRLLMTDSSRAARAFLRLYTKTACSSAGLASIS